MKLITHEQIMSLNISQKQGYEWIKESFLTKKDCQLPPKTSMVEEGHVFYNVMPSLNHNHKIGGIKMVTRLPGRNPSLNSEIFLYNMEDAKLKAILDGNYITAFRTAAVAALAIDTFAKKDFNTIAIMGLGVTASAIMNMLLHTLKDKNINIKLLRYKDQAELFIKKYEKNEQFSFEICDTHEELIIDSDVVISTVTYTDEYLSEFKWFKKGALLLPVHVMGFGNVDYLFDKVYLDDYNHLKHLENIDRYKYSCEFYDVLSKQAKGRENDDERIISYNIGLSIHDILFANKIYELCETLNCDEIELKEPKEKYWI
ncbi:ornithine cyclodeaminase [Clostridioides difficile]|uniref:ornithine cyclodeaminase n=1 Tax=Clostridioides difficile TaxID=1496 RepID=UPI000D1E67BD|nr:ornithine cyclodeaminase [Clostridioides difficile]MDL5066962.1 ornithine cyclodeaminase [Clostridioides difficile]MDN9452844.1 ornithine cyclodeaminase [Clostridioides difficile]MDN9636663.1 ornithine cyclodeaminase [Clostridioides difficile]HBF7898131.1 ornithine cyclodeaminase [Clostridioides difficile]